MAGVAVGFGIYFGTLYLTSKNTKSPSKKELAAYKKEYEYAKDVIKSAYVDSSTNEVER